MITPEKLAEWEALADRATTGPWRLDDMGMFVFGPDHEMIVSESVDENVLLRGVGGGLPMEENAQFIAASRTIVPEAIAEIRRLRAELAKVTEQCDAYGTWAGELVLQVVDLSEKLNAQSGTFAAGTEWAKEQSK